MTDRQIISLLKRYMEGATTVEEETALAEFFGMATDADRPDAISADDWRTYKEMFGMFASERVLKINRRKLRLMLSSASRFARLLCGWHRLL